MSPRFPSPNTSSSAGSSKLTGLPFDNISGNAPSEFLPLAFRLKKILNGAKNRCQAIPIVKLVAITTNQSIDIKILTAAIT